MLLLSGIRLGRFLPGQYSEVLRASAAPAARDEVKGEYEIEQKESKHRLGAAAHCRQRLAVLRHTVVYRQIPCILITTTTQTHTHVFIVS